MSADPLPVPLHGHRRRDTLPLPLATPLPGAECPQVHVSKPYREVWWGLREVTRSGGWSPCRDQRPSPPRRGHRRSLCPEPTGGSSPDGESAGASTLGLQPPDCDHPWPSPRAVASGTAPERFIGDVITWSGSVTGVCVWGGQLTSPCRPGSLGGLSVARGGSGTAASLGQRSHCPQRWGRRRLAGAAPALT